MHGPISPSKSQLPLHSFLDPMPLAPTFSPEAGPATTFEMPENTWHFKATFIQELQPTPIFSWKPPIILG